MCVLVDASNMFRWIVLKSHRIVKKVRMNNFRHFFFWFEFLVSLHLGQFKCRQKQKHVTHHNCKMVFVHRWAGEYSIGLFSHLFTSTCFLLFVYFITVFFLSPSISKFLQSDRTHLLSGGCVLCIAKLIYELCKFLHGHFVFSI